MDIYLFLPKLLERLGLPSGPLTDINLSELQKTLDGQGIEVVENQKESVVGRKGLADRTKGAWLLVGRSSHSLTKYAFVEWKKLPDEEKLGGFKSLLKGVCFTVVGIISCRTLIFLTAYQTEIDSLTKRAKSAENAFLDVYKVLAEAPDPYPLLEAAVVRFVPTVLEIYSH